MARRWPGTVFVVVAAALGGVTGFFVLAPGTAGETTIVVKRGDTLAKVLSSLQAKGVVRSAVVAQFVAKSGNFGILKEGVRIVRARATIRQALDDLKVVVQQSVRVPDGYWVKRTADHLERHAYCSSGSYRQAAQSFEGKLYPDTYALPPMATAEELVHAQLAAYKAKVAPVLEGADEARVLTVASLVELEASDPDERKMVAGVIENRLAKGMRLEIDATVLYAMQEWKVLGPGVVHTVDSPYNTYEHAGLPPGPICSPSLESVKAALRPARHRYYYYVGKGSGRHLFAETYEQHLANIRLVRQGVTK